MTPFALTSPLTPEQRELLTVLRKENTYTILAMLRQSQSGHPGGSLSALDFLNVLYAGVITNTGEPVIVSNGHISPGVYSVLASCGYVHKQDVIENFRQVGSHFEGHVTRIIPGVWYGTGPLGIGVSVASGMALGKKLQGSKDHVYAVMGDGEAQEGQVHEMIHFAAKYQLDNFIVFVDFNEVQLTDSLDSIMPIDIEATFKAGGWNTISIDGHDFDALWESIGKAHAHTGTPTVIIGKTIMGKGVPFMESEGQAKKSTWHGSAPKPDAIDEVLSDYVLDEAEEDILDQFRNAIAWHPKTPQLVNDGTTVELKLGKPRMYSTETITDCRSAYGNALLDLAKENSKVLAMTADLGGSVKTNGVLKELPSQHIECGICEQHMVSVAGGLSLMGFIPFASTFGAFMTSRAKDQARVNDINRTNVKMVATHCGLSVGEDGPTHQAIDDKSSFLGFFHTQVLEPADPNQCDRMVRFAAAHYGNFYIRMGRHKFPVISKLDGTPYFDENYTYTLGKCDIIREGTDITILASGAMVGEALKAIELSPNNSVELIAVSSLKHFDESIAVSVQKTKKLITVEDHNTVTGLSSQVSKYLCEQGIAPEKLVCIGVKEYQLSGKAKDLYAHAKMDAEAIAHVIQNL